MNIVDASKDKSNDIVILESEEEWPLKSKENESKYQSDNGKIILLIKFVFLDIQITNKNEFCIEK